MFEEGGDLSGRLGVEAKLDQPSFPHGEEGEMPAGLKKEPEEVDLFSGQAQDERGLFS